MAGGSHPYYPLGADIVGYSPNQTPVLELLVTAGGGCAVLLGLTFALASYVRPTLCVADRIAILWFVLCMTPPMLPDQDEKNGTNCGLAGTLHCFFEGYFMLHHEHMASAQDLFGQLWKEYALSDSRYMTSDTLVLCMETMTVVSAHSPKLGPGLSKLNPLTNPIHQLLWGPLCFVVAYLTATRHSLRHPMQVVVCMSHLYGDTLYYVTSLFDHYVHDRPYSRPERYYFWVYYFLMNFIWIVVPFCKLSVA
ncbi:hypothetical protein N7520_004453 [Penicillium odoratum]|uniref:uncharacterized protein n=1 Tax=Penicillium odoratum TaxID=1167516 RepID=UPI002546D8BC|nr:uncharacterized protein N7520_004453 [Penicillium odoratum]KAJ5764894.1 hypothetical protein N7520_004453 [Penicillium odoratum]